MPTQAPAQQGTVGHLGRRPLQMLLLSIFLAPKATAACTLSVPAAPDTILHHQGVGKDGRGGRAAPAAPLLFPCRRGRRNGCLPPRSSAAAACISIEETGT